MKLPPPQQQIEKKERRSKVCSALLGGVRLALSTSKGRRVGGAKTRRERETARQAREKERERATSLAAFHLSSRKATICNFL